MEDHSLAFALFFILLFIFSSKYFQRKNFNGVKSCTYGGQLKSPLHDRKESLNFFLQMEVYSQFMGTWNPLAQNAAIVLLVLQNTTIHFYSFWRDIFVKRPTDFVELNWTKKLSLRLARLLPTQLILCIIKPFKIHFKITSPSY